MSRVWLVASGKGGVGKSTVSSCLAIAMTRLGRTVCVIDTDIGLRDQDLILGLSDRIVYDLLDVCSCECTLDKALISSERYPGLSLLGAAQMARSKDLNAKMLSHVVRGLRKKFDEIFIDCPAGIERGLRNILRCEIDGAIVVCTPDDVCIRDAERCAELLQSKGMPKPRVIVNRLIPDLIRCGEMYNAQTVADTLDLELLGEIHDDSAVYRALMTHRTAMDVECEAEKDIMRIARRMNGETVELPHIGMNRLKWWQRLFHDDVERLKERRS